MLLEDLFGLPRWGHVNLYRYTLPTQSLIIRAQRQFRADKKPIFLHMLTAKEIQNGGDAFVWKGIADR